MDETNTWEVLLFLGRVGQLAGDAGAEALFRQALESAQTVFGNQSPQAGLCLMDLADWLEKDGRQEEADSITARYRAIICLHFPKLG